ncbi:MAG TPA: c-type cytochrome [Vicinamibacterales bacterium]|nr:c-type cytochrome [Vicinamibacterales bacterium]
MNSRARVIILALACFVLGAALQKLSDSRRTPNTLATQTIASEAAPGAAAERSPVGAAPADLTGEPLWAYGFDAPAKPGEKAKPQAAPNRQLRQNEGAAEQTRLRHIDGSPAAFSLVDIRDGQNVVDWFPSEHPPMPDVVAHGPVRLGPARRGCASCHLPSGKGRPENAAPVGLPVTYFIRQIDDFRSGRRHTVDPRKPNTNTMIELAKAMTPEEVTAAADYFGSMKWTPWVRVVETNLVPKTRISGNLFLPASEALTEPIAGRIIEMPENEEQAETYRNPHSGFVAYVPVGSVAKGADLATTGGMRIVGDKIVQGKTTPCATCHGPDLMGVADVPPIAGRSPSYLARQLFDMQRGARDGASAQLMKLVVANLTAEDMLSIAAYISSRGPSATPLLTAAAATRR